MVGFGLLDALLEFGQQLDGALDLTLQRRAVRRRRFQILQRPLRERRDPGQLPVERLRLRLRLGEKLRRCQDALAHRATGVAPGAIERARLPRCPPLFGESGAHAPAMLPADTRGWRQIPHGERSSDLAFPHQLLHRFRQGVNQRQARGYPGLAAVEAPGEFFQRATQTGFHLGQQPALFNRALRLAHPQRPVQRQRVGFAHFPDDRLDRVAAQLLECRDALVTVDDQKAAGSFDDDDGRLLAHLSQRSDQPTLARRMPYPEAFQAAVQLMKLQSHR
jgi:hypothetical protein